MSSKTAAGYFPPTLVESLEPRIAPAVLFAGPTADGGSEYGTLPVKPTDLVFKTALTAPIQVGDPSLNFTAGDHHFYLDLKSGDSVQIFSDGWQPFIKVTGGRAFAFFLDKNLNNIPESNELTGFSLGLGANVTVNGDVDGDVIANLDTNFTNPGGSKGAISTDDLINTKQTIAGFSVTGSVNGRIMAGGNVNLITVGNGIEQINTGTPDGAYNYDFGGTGSGALVGKGTIGLLDPGSKQAAGNISNVKIGSGVAIWAGDGGAGGKGGDITNITVSSDADGIDILAGAGGAGNSLTSATGGLGGKVSQVLFKGVPDLTQNLIHIAAGDGGDTFLTSKAVAGNGGLVEKIYIGYDLFGTKYIESSSLLKDNVIVSAGSGGAGTSAGNGGTVTNVNILASPNDLLPGDEIQVLGGNGGALWAAGTKAGLGGSVTTFNIQNLDAAAGGFSGVLVHGGDASASALLVPATGSAAVGGAISGGGSTLSPLVGSDFSFIAGAGSDTETAGGAGGSVSNLSFGVRGATILNDLLVDAGDGGTTTKGAGGIGGDITGVFAPLAKISTFSLSAGDGGDSLGSGTAGGSGGRGGNISKIGNITDSDTSALSDVTATAGAGGDGIRGGGLGGSVSTLGFFANYASLHVTAGNGGSATGATGTGAAGGSISSVAFTTKTIGDLAQDVSLTAGDGGNAKGISAAGLGGSVTVSNVQAVGNVTFTAGDGGHAETKGTTGGGGSLGSSSAASGLLGISREGNVAYLAGDSGTAVGFLPTKGGNGGSIINAVAASSTNITFKAGDGLFGGNGGDLSRIGYYGISAGAADPSVAPMGTILVQAGTGGDAPSATGTAGRGGNITTLTGYSADFTAGNGGAHGKAGAGGTINGISILGGGEFSIVAGNGGSGDTSGGVGGSVLNVAVIPDVVVRTIAAGDGGDTVKGKGANGGSITKVDVQSDIGFRSGKNFGFATDATLMGGLFAGRGGVDTTTPLDTKLFGTAGNVTNITAKAISSIVAGRAASPQLVGTVDGIFLRGLEKATVNTHVPVTGGAFTNFGTANLVGGKAGDPSLALADAFHFVGGGTFSPSDAALSPWTLNTTSPLDGLIAAINLTSKRNFAPLAFLTNTAAKITDTPVYNLLVPVVPLA